MIPEIYSARYAGVNANSKQNIEKLLQAMIDVPEEKRTARFHCVIVYLKHESDPMPLISHGSWEGKILLEEKGEFGFGYDPVFYVPEYQCSSAELKPELKNEISHRAKALKIFITQMNDVLRK